MDRATSRLSRWGRPRYGGIPIATGGVSDHVHVLATLKPVHSVSDVLQSIKKASSSGVHDEVLRPRFTWQEGYAAFSVGASHVSDVRRYVMNQATHHAKVDSRTEVLALCKAAGVEVDMRYFQ
jgi:putative transposase